jgi:hypothetical protein
MAKGKSTWKYNKLLTGRRNYYSGGGGMGGGWQGQLFQDIASSVQVVGNKFAQGLGEIALMNHNKWIDKQNEQASDYARTQQGRTMTENAQTALAQAKEDRLQETELRKSQEQERQAQSFFQPKMFWGGGGLGNWSLPELQLPWAQTFINPLYASPKLNRIPNMKIALPKMDFSLSKPSGLNLQVPQLDFRGTGAAGAGAASQQGVQDAAQGAVQDAAQGAAQGAAGGDGAGLLAMGLAVDRAAGKLIGGDYHTGAGDVLGALPGLGIVGGLTNRFFGMKTNQAELNRVKSETTALANDANQASAATSFDDNSLSGPTNVDFNVKAYKGGVFSKGKARRKNRALATELRAAADFAGRTATNSIDNIADNQMNNAQATFAAFGGELNTQGGDFTNGMVQVNAGGSHESNPLQGVPMGVDQQGVPNLVEEGEVIFNDYVFSRRLAVPKAIREKYKLRSAGKVTFADAIKKLSKESEERPNDPISKNGLNAIVSELASAQEQLKAKKGRQFSHGGHLFNTGGYAYNNSSNDANIVNHAMFAPYFSNNTFDFDAMYANGSAYRAGLDTIAAALYKRKQDPNYQFNDTEAGYLASYINSVNQWNPDNKYGSINDLSYDKIIGDALTTSDGTTFNYNPNATGRGFALDRKRGGHHFGVAGVQAAPTPVTTAAKNRYFEFGTTNPLDYFEGRNEKGQTWFDLNPGYSFVDKNGTVRDPVDEDGVSTTYTDFYLKKNEPEVQEEEEGDEWQPGHYNSWLRYAPAVGFGMSVITDAFGLTNKPDYSNADAILEAAQGAGTYNPVSFKPIGNYLTYNPLDRDYYINKMNAEAGATRRNIMNTSGGNRGAAMAGILAADNNYLNQLGSLARQAEEYNFAQRAQVEEFNRGTNTTNSQGFLQADLANQKAAAEAREMSLKGTMAAAELREKTKLASDAARNANISGLFQTLGDIGYEERNMQMMDYALGHGLFGTGAEDGYAFTRGKRKPKKKADGGLIRRKRKGLTF